MGNIQGECIGLGALAWQHLLQGDLPSARRTFQRALVLAQQIQSITCAANCLNGVAMVDLVSEGRAESGARLFGAAEAMLESVGVVLMEGPDRVETPPFLEQGRRALGDEAWEIAVEAGRHLDIEEAVRLANTSH
jgi:non-specific serine/threonine protein kinase